MRKAISVAVFATVMFSTALAQTTPEVLKIEKESLLKAKADDTAVVAWRTDILPGVTDMLPHTGSEARDLLMKTICRPSTLPEYIKRIIERIKHLGAGLRHSFNVCYFRGSFDFSQFYRGFSGSISLSALRYPPRFYISLPRQIKLKHGKIEVNIPEAKWLSQRNRSGNPIPVSPETTKRCLENGKSKECSALTSTVTLADNSEFLADTVAKKVNSQSIEKIVEQSSNVTEAIAESSNIDEIDQNSTQSVSLRNAYMNEAATSPFAVVIPGKEARAKVPTAVRKKYDAIAYKAYARDTYIKSFQRRIEIHYQQIIKLKELVDKVCALPTDTPPVADTEVKKSSFGSSVIGSGSVLGFSKKQTKSSVEIASRSLSGAVARKVVKAMEPAINKALAAQTGQLTTVMTETTSAAQEATAETLADDGKKTRERIQFEGTAERNLQKSLICTQLQLELERTMIELDSLEATVALLSSSFTQIQEKESSIYRSDAKKWFKRGFDH